MFESSTFDSMGTIHTRSRNWMFATFALNTSVLALLVAIPLLHPAMLPQILRPIAVEAPPPTEESRPLPQQTLPAASASDMMENHVVAPSRIPKGAWIPDKGGDIGPGAAISLNPAGLGTGSPDNPFTGTRTPQVVRPIPQPKPHVTSFVMEGYLLNKVLPTYPPLARAMRLSGRVELQATISRGGTIENLRVRRGPAVFQQAAIDAVKQWRYRPYLLNGQPVEVETAIDVDFTLN